MSGRKPQSGPGGRTRTRTGRGLSSLPLHWATPGKMNGAPGRNFACNLRVRSAVLYTLSYGSVMEKWRPWMDLHHQPPDPKSGALHCATGLRSANRNCTSLSPLLVACVAANALAECGNGGATGTRTPIDARP